ncbi:MAG: ATP-binding protein [Bacteroidaceae bacterium]|nr:ATP-binding protein [Bacteroidaceae bacterium]
MNKPFVYGVSVGSEHFVGRKAEIEKLSSYMRYGVNTILISPRRIGKTSLVKRVAGMIANEHIRVVHLDIFSCRSEYDFYNALAEAVLKQTASKLDEWKQYAQDFLSRLVPRISFSPEPNQDFSISLGITPQTYKPEEILELPELIAKKNNYHIVVCIDEFQQIGEFPDSMSIQKRIRTVWQHQQNVSYCLYGSKKHMMGALFQQRSNPFYKFGTTMYLDVIPTKEWIPYLCGRYEQEGKWLRAELAERLCSMVENHSSYVQQLAFYTLINTKGKETTETDLQAGYTDLLNENTPLFMEKTERLTTYQMNFLRAVIHDIHKDFGTAAIRTTYNLGASSNVARIREALLEKEIIDITPDGIFIADPILRAWLIKTI